MNCKVGETWIVKLDQDSMYGNTDTFWRFRILSIHQHPDYPKGFAVGVKIDPETWEPMDIVEAFNLKTGCMIRCEGFKLVRRSKCTTL